MLQLRHPSIFGQIYGKYRCKSVFGLQLEVFEQDGHVHIAATDHAAHLLRLKAVVLQHCRHHRSRGRLNHDLHTFKHQLRCRNYLLLTHQDDVLTRQMFPQDVESQRSQTSPQAVSNRYWRQLSHYFSFLQGKLGIPSQIRLHSDRSALSAKKTRTEDTSTAESSSSNRKDQVIQILRIFESLLGSSGLASDDFQIVVGMDEMSIVLLRYPFCCFLAVLQGVSRFHHIPTVPNHPTLLDEGGVARHDDIGSESQCGCGIGQGLCVVAGGVGADSGDDLVHLEQFVESPSGLECPYLLKVLTFEEQLRAASHACDGVTGEQRSSVDVGLDAFVCSLYDILPYHLIIIVDWIEGETGRKQWFNLLRAYYRTFLMLSQSTINEALEVDVLFVGNLAAIAADLLATKTGRFKLAVSHLEPQIDQPVLFPLASTLLNITSKPKGAQVVRQRIRRVNVGQRSVFLEDGKKITYQMLVYGEESSRWRTVPVESPFREALLTPYSLVFAGCDPRWEEMLQLKSGNLIFYVGKGPGSHEQNYPFLYIHDRLSTQQQQRMKFMVILEGQTFYQHCPIAHRVLEQQLRRAKFRIVYGATVTKVDYLKRTLEIKTIRDGNECIPYASLHCSLPESPPELLLRQGVDVYRSHEKYLHNQQFDSLYVIGGAILPTTHSYSAVNHQMHVIVANLRARLDFLYGFREKLQLAVYRGTSAIRIIISRNELLEIVHGYKDHEHEIKNSCSTLAFVITQQMDRFLAEKYYNFKSYGLPHLFCSPSTTPEPPREEQGTLSQLKMRTNAL